MAAPSVRARLKAKRQAPGVFWRALFSIKDALEAAGVERREREALVREVDAYRRSAPPARPRWADFHLGSAVLRTHADAAAAVDEVRALGLSPYDSPAEKTWDSLAALSAILKTTGPGSRVLDAGAVFGSKILPWLSAYGYTNLTGINLSFRSPVRVGRILYDRGDLTRTGCADASVDAVACLSVIEHGVDVRSYLAEMWRILTPGGILVTSTDYWPEPLDTREVTAFGAGWRIFNRDSMRDLLDTAARLGFVLDGAPQLDAQDRTVAWYGREYTFMYWVLTKPLQGRPDRG